MFAAIAFVIETLLILLGALFVLRVWLRWAHVAPFDPLSSTVLQLTEWAARPLRRILPDGRRTDWASLMVALLVALVDVYVRLLIYGMSPRFPFAMLLEAVLVALRWGVSLVMWLTVLTALLSWLNPHAPIMPVLQALTRPLLAPIQRLLPRLGGVDLSPLFVFIGAQALLIVIAGFSRQLAGI